MSTSAEYVEQTATGGWRVAGTRVSLESVIHLHQQGATPEAIVDEFPTLTLEQVYGTIAHYLRHRPDMDAYLARVDEAWEKGRAESEVRNAALLARLRAHRERAGKNGDAP